MGTRWALKLCRGQRNWDLGQRRALRTQRNAPPPSGPNSPVAPAGLQFVNRPLSDLWKAAAFSSAVCGGCLVGSVIWKHESWRESSSKNSSFWSENFSRTAGHGRVPKLGWRQKVEDWWAQRTAGQRMVLSLISVNVGVFVAWQVGGLRPFMYRYFASSFYSEKLLSPMVLSVFSHSAPLHLAANMYVLYSFGAITADRFTGKEYFLGLFMAGGVASSLASHAFRAATRARSFSVGASGAVLACLVYACAKMPDSRLQIIFLPFFTFSAFQGIVGIMALDTAGLLLGWRLFDHAAHLGGSVFGLWYAYLGEDLIRKAEPAIVDAWTRLAHSGEK